MMKITLSTASAIAYLTIAIGMTLASDDTIGPNGINSVDLTLPDPNRTSLTGAGISIGQVEPGRPMDPDLNDTQFNQFIDPEMVFFKTTDGNNMDGQIDAHALHVAGVMISSDVRTGDQLVPPDSLPGRATGVAPQANLYASAIGPSNASADIMVAANHVATRNNNEVWAINYSFGHDPNLGQPDLRDGNSQLTLFVDWLASKHDVLNVSAFGESPKPPTAFAPTDNFNGITVAASSKVSGVYSQVASLNDYSFDALGERTSVDLIAPGVDFVLASLGGTRQLAGGPDVGNGTSWAAPHVTGTVALLQQYSDYQITNTESPQWTANAQRHEVMKAVLMNSADKLIDNGMVHYPGTSTDIPQGRLLGMERTVVKQNGTHTWFQSEAFLEAQTFLFDTPLDDQMGTGHLNAKRALQQLIPGEHEFNGNFGQPTVGEVPHIGWDLGTIEGPNYPINKYKLEGTLDAGHFFSATLAWDRVVEFDNDTDQDGEYDLNDTFEEYTDLSDVLRDLDLYLVRADANDVGENDILVSQSSVTSVEHIFGEIPETGEYELWVYRKDQFAPDQDYGLAWWYGLAPEIEPPDDITGDFNGDLRVDGRDFLAWQRNPSVGDLADWQTNYGFGTLAAATAVPEPSCLPLLIGLVFLRRNRV